MNAATPALPAQAEEFVARVLSLGPRLAVFDCDGTLWRDDAGELFFAWEIARGLLPRDVVAWAEPRYADYRAGRVDEVTMCGEMVTLHRGIANDVLERAAVEFFDERMRAVIFPEMVELTRRLRESGCELWAVSSTNDWVVRAGLRYFSIAPERVAAASVRIEDGRATGRLIRVPTDEYKAVAIRELLPRLPDVAFGNSIHDLSMLGLAQHAFAVNSNPDLAQVAQQRGWTVYSPSRG
jgi:phosphoserine phosphatase